MLTSNLEMFLRSIIYVLQPSHGVRISHGPWLVRAEWHSVPGAKGGPVFSVMGTPVAGRVKLCVLFGFGIVLVV